MRTNKTSGRGAFPYLLLLTVGSSVGYWVGRHQAQPATEPVSRSVSTVSRAPQVLEVRFSPRGGGRELAVHTIGLARKTIDMGAYSFTSPEICRALIDAHRRGVRVRLVVDRSQQAGLGSQVGMIAKAGIPVRVARRGGNGHRQQSLRIMHHKVIVVDGMYVLTGSYNFTTNAELHNAENMLLIRDATIAQMYERELSTLYELNADNQV